MLPEGLSRRVIALTDATAIACGLGDAIVAIPGETGTSPAWIV